MKTSPLSIGLTLASALVYVATLFPHPLRATTLVVYNNNDSGAGSLRQAIADNRALGGGNTILFSNVVSGTITLTTGELLISNNVTILGPGANVLAIDGNAAFCVFHTRTNTSVISGLTITNGSTAYSGGGIFSEGATLTVNDCVIFRNSASVARGGGICNFFGTLAVNRCTISSNSASFGGGIANYDGALTVSGCTFSGNSAAFGGGIAIINDLTTVGTVSGCTLSGNSAALGGGIDNGGTLTIGDTILKAGTSGGNIRNESGGTVTSLGYNVSSDTGSGFLMALGDQINTDPMLGPLQNNGGPTATHMPLPGSPAIDQGKNLSGFTTDQRGRCRTYDDPDTPNATGGDGTDIGAVEVSPAHVAPVVMTTADGFVSGTLRYCNCDSQPGESVTFASNVTGTIALTLGELFVDRNASILGPGANVLAINAEAASSVFHVSNSVVTIAGLTITNGLSLIGLGSGILNDHGSVTVSNCVISGHSGATFGGGIFNNGGVSSATLTLIGSTVSGNSAILGAGIFNDAEFSGHATLSVIASTVCSNASTDGGGIYNYGDSSGSTAACTVLGSTLSGNSAGSLGGSIYNIGADGGAATLQVGDTILKTGPAGTNFYNTAGTITSLGYNLSDDNGNGFLTATGDKTNTDAMLGPLQDNGGPTPTMALLAGSPAIDQGKSFGLSTDQRGAPRPFDFTTITNASGGDGSDIGAFEVQLPLLNIQKAGNAALLSWPNYYGNFSVQTNSRLATSGGWGYAPGTASVLDTQYVLTNSPLSGNRFFRLKSN